LPEKPVGDDPTALISQSCRSKNECDTIRGKADKKDNLIFILYARMTSDAETI